MGKKRGPVAKKIVTYNDIFKYAIETYSNHTVPMRTTSGAKEKSPNSTGNSSSVCVAIPHICEVQKKCLCLDEEQLAVLSLKEGASVRFREDDKGYRVTAGSANEGRIVRQAMDALSCPDYKQKPGLFGGVAGNRNLTWAGTAATGGKDAKAFIRMLPLIESINQANLISSRDTFAYMCVYGDDTEQARLAFLIELIWRLSHAYVYDRGSLQATLDMAEIFLTRVVDLQKEKDSERFRLYLTSNANRIKESFENETRGGAKKTISFAGQEEQRRFDRNMRVSDEGLPGLCEYLGIGISELLKEYVQDIENERPTTDGVSLFAYRNSKTLTVWEKLWGFDKDNEDWQKDFCFNNNMFHIRLIFTLLVEKLGLSTGYCVRSQILLEEREREIFFFKNNCFDKIENRFKSGETEKAIKMLDTTFKRRLTDVLNREFPMVNDAGTWKIPSGENGSN